MSSFISDEPIILIVEDNEDTIEIFSLFFSHVEKGYKICIARNLEEANELFCKHKTKIVGMLMDYKLGEGNTEEFVKFLRKSNFLGPILAISNSREWSEILVKAGCSHLSNKSLEAVKDLLEILDK